MPLTSSEKAIARPGESRKIGLRSTSNNRDPSHQRPAASLPNQVHQRNQAEEASSQSRRLSIDKANALRVDVPDTLTPQTFQSSRWNKKDSGRGEVEEERARRGKATTGPFAAQRTSRPSATNQAEPDDDTVTTSLTFNDTGWDESDQDIDGQRTAVFRGEWMGRLAGGTAAAAASASAVGGELDRVLDGFSDGEDIYGDDPLHELSRETPSRTGTVPSKKKAPVVAPAPARAPAPVSMAPKPPATRRRVDFFLDRDSSPIDEEFEKIPRQAQARAQQAAAAVNLQSSLARHAELRQEVRSSTPAPAPAPLGQQPAKVAASSDEGAADSDAQNPFARSATASGTKRAHEEIDYDPDELAGKSYADLDNVPFLTDPRAPPPPPPMTGQAGEEAEVSRSRESSTEPTGRQQQQRQRQPALDVQLEKLSQLATTADQIQLFQSLSEAENEQAGAWFATWFGESVKQVQQLRLQRRKTALKYEMEARKRQRAVEAKMAECEAQLADMKQGGSKLVAGRSAERLGMTPRRESKFAAPS